MGTELSVGVEELCAGTADCDAEGWELVPGSLGMILLLTVDGASVVGLKVSVSVGKSVLSGVAGVVEVSDRG